MAVEPSSEKNTFASRGVRGAGAEVADLTSFSASNEAGSLARPRAEEWATFPSCFRMAELILGWLWPWRLVQMEELASRYSRPRTSRSTAPRPEAMTMGSRLSQSRIWVKGCQT